MATIQEMRDKLKKINDKRGGGGGKSKWFPKDRHVVRLLPIPGQDEPYKVLFFHYLNKKPIYCPMHNSGTDCDICKLSESLKAWDDDMDADERKKQFKLGCQLEAGPKYYHPMTERITDKETKKVSNSAPAWWSLSEPVWKEVAVLCLKDENIEMHAENGQPVYNVWDLLVNTASAFDLDVDLRKANNEDKKGNLKQYNATVVTERKRENALTKDKDELEKLLAAIPSFDGIETVLTSEEVAKILQNHVNAEAEPVKSTSDGTEKSASTDKVESHSTEKLAEGKRSVEDALSDMLNT
jgi:hypothetical protein